MYSIFTLLLTAGTVFVQLSSAAPHHTRTHTWIPSRPSHSSRPSHPSHSSHPSSSSSVLIPLPSATVTSALTSSNIELPTTTAAGTGASTTSISARPSSTPSGTIWKPAAGSTWQIMLSTIPSSSDLDLPVDIFDLDLVDNSASTIATLHSKGKKAICYFSAGTFENWRPDQKSFQSSDLGAALPDWAGESWLDTRSANVRSIMTARIDLAKSKGCDGVDPDNVDAYNNENGLGLTAADAVDYLQFLAGIAHSRGLSIGLKNGGEIVGDVLAFTEWQVNEQCVEFDECELFAPFISAGKPVFHIEYPSGAPSISVKVKDTSCTLSPNGFSTILKTLNLDAWIDTC